MEQHTIIQQLKTENEMLKEKMKYYDKKMSEIISGKVKEAKDIERLS